MQFLSSRYVVVKTKKLPLKIIAENSVIQQGNESNMTVMKNLPLLEKKRRRRRRRQRRRRRRRNMKLKVKALKRRLLKNEVFSKTTKNVQKASSTPPSKRQLTVMETLQINKMKRDKEAGDKKKKRKCGKNTAEVTAEKSQFLQQVAEYVSKKHGRGQLIVNF